MTYPNNVPQIIKTLELYFGQPEFIIRDLIEDVKNQPSPKLDKAGTLIQFSITVNNAVQTMLSSGMKDHLWNPILLQDILEKLPTNMKYEWAEFKINKANKVNLEDFNQWLQQKAVVASRLLSSAPTLSDNTRRHPRNDGVFTHIEERKCIICSSNCLSVSRCESFVNKSYEEKWELVNLNKLCRVCLKRHRGRCNTDACAVPGCTYRHHTLLHKQLKAAESLSVNNHLHECYSNLFKILPVKLHHRGKCVDTFAMLDDGSSVTLMETQLADKLELKGTAQSLCLKWTAGTTRQEPSSKIVSVYIYKDITITIKCS